MWQCLAVSSAGRTSHFRSLVPYLAWKPTRLNLLMRFNSPLNLCALRGRAQVPGIGCNRQFTPAQPNLGLGAHTTHPPRKSGPQVRVEAAPFLSLLTTCPPTYTPRRGLSRTAVGPVPTSALQTTKSFFCFFKNLC